MQENVTRELSARPRDVHIDGAHHLSWIALELLRDIWDETGSEGPRKTVKVVLAGEKGERTSTAATNACDSCHLRFRARQCFAAALGLAGDIGRQHSDNAPLFGQNGGFDSVAVLKLIMSIEEEFDITIDERDIAPANFKTVATLTRYIESKIA